LARRSSERVQSLRRTDIAAKETMAGGIAPKLLCEQVENTAAWSLEGPTDTPELSWRRALVRGRELEPVWTEPEHRTAYFELMLAAHYATVATFVPTDVDTRIRYHAWQECRERAQLEAMIALTDHAAQHWSAPAMSARTVDVGLGPVSGHDGEWFSVRAGALGRAIHLRHEDLAEHLAATIDAELDRERESFELALRTRGKEIDALRIGCAIAHNLGDLSRVVVDWVAKGPVAERYVLRYGRLGHDDAANPVKTFQRVGALNKAVTALENHRFLALRKPRGLRKHRALLLPIGPFFDEWGRAIATHASLDRAARAEVLSVLIDAHEADPSQQGYLRAMAGIHSATRGGLDDLARELPAKQRRAVSGGAIREALGVSPERFEARMVNRLRQALGK
jgi:hypothetical protein